MVENAVKTLKQRQAEIASQIKVLEKEASAIAKALVALDAGKTVGRVGARPATVAAAAPAAAAAPKRARKKMSKLGKLKIRLGSLNRFGKKEEAKKVQEKIDALLKAGAKD